MRIKRIQAIKIPVIGNGDEEELSFDYDADDDHICVYLKGKYLFGMNYTDNFKQAIEKILEKW